MGMSWVHRGDSVRIGETPVGKGVFAERSYPVDSVIGEITGEVNYESDGSSYSFEIDENTQLEPYAPYRYLNHSCDPNCEFNYEEVESGIPILYVIALREIRSGEELTIDYNWPADAAIPCQCGAHNCRGWIVWEGDLERVLQVQRLRDSMESVPERKPESNSLPGSTGAT